MQLREREWEGLPPPPEPKPTAKDERDPIATPIATSLGLPGEDPQPNIFHRSPPESITTLKTNVVPASPITQSPSISVSSLSDFTIADTSDDESPIDPIAIASHDTFYLEDGNVEVLCGHTLFRVHTSTLSFHSPALRQMFAQASPTSAESPNGCPRILSSDSPSDFTTLLKVIYLPGYVALFLRNERSPNHLPADSLNGTRSRISLHSRPSYESHPSMNYSPSGLSYSSSFAMRTQRISRGFLLPGHLGRAPSADQPLTRTRS